MQSILKILLLIIIFFTGEAIFSQQLPVQLKPPPQYHFFTEDMFKMTITNTSQETYRIYLHGRATEQSKGMIVDASSSSFLLQPGTRQVKSSDVGKVTVNESNSTYKDVISQMGQLPTGNYEICVEVINEATNQVIGSDCISHEVLQVSQMMLVYPNNQSDIAFGKLPEIIYGDSDYVRIGKKWDKLKNKIFHDTGGDDEWKVIRKWNEQYGDRKSTTNSQITFSWLPPVPVPRGYSVRYKIKIAEIVGQQSAYDAMQSNPLFYNQSNIVTTSYQYPVAARNFSAGRKYAWQVQAFVNGVLLSESEVWSFQYGQNTASYRGKVVDATDKSKQKTLKDIDFNSFTLVSHEAGSLKGIMQKKSKMFQFLFSSTAYGESSNRSGTGSDKEPRYGTLELTPSLSIYGLPFSTSFLFSSENSSSRQNINTAGMNLDVSTIKDLIMERVNKEKDKLIEEGKKELSNLTEKQKEKLEGDAKSKVMSRMNPILKFISYFQTLGIGTTYPSYTPLTLQGVAVTGLNVEFNPGWFYIALTGAKNQKPIDNVSYRRDLYSARIGYGQKDKSHVYLTGLYANDKAGSIKVDTTNQLLTPNSNYLFGIEGKLNLLKNKLTIEAEAVGSMLTRDNRDADLENKSIPNFVKNLFHPKISSQIDYSYTVKTTFNNEKSDTKLKAEVKMIGPGFITLGNPTLRGDKLQIEGKIEQKFMNKQVSVSAFVKWLRDNLIKSKLSTTTTLIPGITVNLRLKKVPYLILTYVPNFMSNDATDVNSKVDYKNHLLTATTGHNLQLGKMNLSSSLSYLFNMAKSLDTASGYTSQSITISEALSFQIPLSVSLSFSTNHTKYTGDYSRIVSFDGSVSYTIEELWTNTVGASSSVEKDKNKKIYIYLGTVFELIKNVSFDIRAEKNIYHDWKDGSQNYDEFLLKGTVTTSW